MNFGCSRVYLTAMLALLAPTANSVGTAPVSFRQVVELAAAESSARMSPERNFGATDQLCVAPITLFVPQILFGIVDEYSSPFPTDLVGSNTSCDEHLLNDALQFPPIFISHPECLPGRFAVLNERRPAPLMAAITYVQWVSASLQMNVLTQEHETALQLVRTEKRRVVAGVDKDVLLIRARLLEAQSRERMAGLKRERLELRSDLACFTALPESRFDSVSEYPPPLPTVAEINADEEAAPPDWPVGTLRLQASVEGVAAARDAAQLNYQSSERDAIRAAGLGKATLGDVLTRNIRADEQFIELLFASSELEVFQLELLDTLGMFDKWAVSDKEPDSAPLQRYPIEKNSAVIPTRKISTASSSHVDNSSSVRAILILPSNRSLKVRECRQLAAVSIDERGGKDATSDVRWSSSNESVAIVSTFGLITGIRPGDVTISATLAGISQGISMTVSEEQRTASK